MVIETPIYTAFPIDVTRVMMYNSRCCFICGAGQAVWKLNSQPSPLDPDKPFFPFLQYQTKTPVNATGLDEEGKCLVCNVCYLFLNQQWESYQMNKTPITKRLYWMKRPAEEYQNVLENPGTFFFPNTGSGGGGGGGGGDFGGGKDPRQILLTPPHPPVSVTKTPSNFSQSVVPTQRCNSMEKNAVETLFSTDNDHFSCYLCSFKDRLSASCPVYTVPQKTKEVPFFTGIIQEKDKNKVEALGNKVLLCKQCSSNLHRQWAEFEQVGHPYELRKYHVYIPSTLRGKMKVALCYLCSVSLSQEKRHLINSRRTDDERPYFPFLTNLYPSYNSMSVSSEGYTICCESCTNLLYKQWHIFEASGVKQEERIYRIHPSQAPFQPTVLKQDTVCIVCAELKPVAELKRIYNNSGANMNISLLTSYTKNKGKTFYSEDTGETFACMSCFNTLYEKWTENIRKINEIETNVANSIEDSSETPSISSSDKIQTFSEDSHQKCETYIIETDEDCREINRVISTHKETETSYTEKIYKENITSNISREPEMQKTLLTATRQPDCQICGSCLNSLHRIDVEGSDDGNTPYFPFLKKHASLENLPYVYACKLCYENLMAQWLASKSTNDVETRDGKNYENIPSENSKSDGNDITATTTNYVEKQESVHRRGAQPDRKAEEIGFWPKLEEDDQRTSEQDFYGIKLREDREQQRKIIENHQPLIQQINQQVQQIQELEEEMYKQHDQQIPQQQELEEEMYKQHGQQIPQQQGLEEEMYKQHGQQIPQQQGLEEEMYKQHGQQIPQQQGLEEENYKQHDQKKLGSNETKEKEYKHQKKQQQDSTKMFDFNFSCYVCNQLVTRDDIQLIKKKLVTKATTYANDKPKDIVVSSEISNHDNKIICNKENEINNNKNNLQQKEAKNNIKCQHDFDDNSSGIGIDNIRNDGMWEIGNKANSNNVDKNCSKDYDSKNLSDTRDIVSSTVELNEVIVCVNCLEDCLEDCESTNTSIESTFESNNQCALETSDSNGWNNDNDNDDRFVTGTHIERIYEQEEGSDGAVTGKAKPVESKNLTVEQNEQEKKNSSKSKEKEEGEGVQVTKTSENWQDQSAMKATATVSPFLNFSMRNHSQLENTATMASTATTNHLSPGARDGNGSFAAALRKLAQQSPFPAPILPREHGRLSPMSKKGEVSSSRGGPLISPLSSHPHLGGAEKQELLLKTYGHMHSREHGPSNLHGSSNESKIGHASKPPLVPGVFQYSERDREGRIRRKSQEMYEKHRDSFQQNHHSSTASVALSTNSMKERPSGSIGLVHPLPSRSHREEETVKTSGMNSMHFSSRESVAVHPLSPTELRYGTYVGSRPHSHASQTSCPVHGHESGSGHQHEERGPRPPGIPYDPVAFPFHTLPGQHPRSREEIQYMRNRHNIERKDHVLPPHHTIEDDLRRRGLDYRAAFAGLPSHLMEETYRRHFMNGSHGAEHGGFKDPPHGQVYMPPHLYFGRDFQSPAIDQYFTHGIPHSELLHRYGPSISPRTLENYRRTGEHNVIERQPRDYEAERRLEEKRQEKGRNGILRSPSIESLKRKHEEDRRKPTYPTPPSEKKIPTNHIIKKSNDLPIIKGLEFNNNKVPSKPNGVIHQANSINSLLSSKLPSSKSELDVASTLANMNRINQSPCSDELESNTSSTENQTTSKESVVKTEDQNNASTGNESSTEMPNEKVNYLMALGLVTHRRKTALEEEYESKRWDRKLRKYRGRPKKRSKRENTEEGSLNGEFRPGSEIDIYNGPMTRHKQQLLQEQENLLEQIQKRNSIDASNVNSNNSAEQNENTVKEDSPKNKSPLSSVSKDDTLKPRDNDHRSNEQNGYGHHSSLSSTSDVRKVSSSSPASSAVHTSRSSHTSPSSEQHHVHSSSSESKSVEHSARLMAMLRDNNPAPGSHMGPSTHQHQPLPSQHHHTSNPPHLGAPMPLRREKYPSLSPREHLKRPYVDHMEEIKVLDNSLFGRPLEHSPDHYIRWPGINYIHHAYTSYLKESDLQRQHLLQSYEELQRESRCLHQKRDFIEKDMSVYNERRMRIAEKRRNMQQNLERLNQVFRNVSQ